MKKLLLVFVIAVGQLNFSSPASHAAVADCLSVSTPTINSSGTSVSATFTIRQTCNITATTNVWPVFKITQDPFGSPCIGSALMQNKIVGTQYLGQITCTLGSGRSGTTSSQLEVWIAWDISTKFINFSYPLIQSPSSSGGGTSGGTGSTYKPIPAPTQPSCSAAPDVPTIAIVQDIYGVSFTVRPAATGQSPTNLAWNFALWDTTNGNWDAWSGWSYTGSGLTFTKKIEKVANKSKVVFSAQSGNSCGYSEQARESASHAGVSLGLILDTLALKPSSGAALPGSTQPLTNFVMSKNDLTVTGTSTNSDICTVNNSQINFLTEGVCHVVFTSASALNFLSAVATTVAIPVEKISLALKVSMPQQGFVGQSVNMDFGETPGFAKASPFIVTSTTTQNICRITGTLIEGLSSGNCEIQIYSLQGSNYKFNNQNFTVEIAKQTQIVVTTDNGARVSLTQKNYSLNLGSASGNSILTSSSTPNICSVKGFNLRLIKVGSCHLHSTASGDDAYKASETLNYVIQIIGNEAVVCVKGKITKIVKGSNSQCPAGYKRK